jgi:hypothetical protein
MTENGRKTRLRGLSAESYGSSCPGTEPPFAGGAREGNPAPARRTRPLGPHHGLRHMVRPRRPLREAGIRIAAPGFERGDPIVPTEKGDQSCPRSPRTGNPLPSLHSSVW